MPRSRLLLSIVTVSSLFFPNQLFAHEHDPGARRSDAKLLEAESNLIMHELELKMSELALEEAILEFEKYKLRVEAAQDQGNPLEASHAKVELKQVSIRVEQQKVQVAMARTRLELARALLQQAKSEGVAPGGDEEVDRSAELQVLGNFVGTWDIEVTSKPKGAQANTFKALSIRKWSRRGKFVIFDDPNDEEFHMAITHDPESESYLGVMMAGLTRGLVSCSWDENTRTMTFAIDNIDGSKYQGTHRFLDESRAEAAGVIRSANGEILLELTYTQVRR